MDTEDGHLGSARKRWPSMSGVAAVAPRVAPVALLVVIAAAGLGFLIWHPEGLFNRHSDLLTYHLGTQTVLHQGWHDAHRLPLWRSDIFSGAPALTNPQSLYTHPLHILFALFQPDRVVGLVIWLQMLIAGLGGYYAGTALRLSVPARLVVAVSTLFSFKMILVVYAGGLTFVAGVAALPLLFGTAAVVLEKPSLRSTLALGGAGALSLHSGNLQLAYYATLFIGLWTAARLGRQILAGNSVMAARTAGSIVLAGLMAIGLSAYLIVPLAADARLITRTAASYEYFLSNDPLSALGLLTIFNPELFGTPLDGSFVEAWEYVVYFGAATSLLALLGAVRGKNRRLARVLVVGLLLSVALSLHTPLLKVLYTWAPGYGLFRIPTRMLFLSAFFAFCLAGVGLEEMLSATVDARSRRTLGAVAIALVALEGSIWAWRYLHVADPIPTVLAADYVKPLASDGEPFRVAPLARSIPNYGSAARLNLQLVAGYDPFNMRHYQTYMDLVQHNRALGIRATNWTDIDRLARLDMIAALNVLYVVAPKRLDIPETEYAFIGSFDNQLQFRFYEGLASGPVYVYRNRRFLNRAFFVSHVGRAADEDTMIREVQNADLRETAIVSAPAVERTSVSTTGDHVDVVRATNGELDLATHNAQARFLLISEVWHPGWHANVDGQLASLERADIALQGLWLEPGDHRIELRYWPPGLTAGLIVTGATAFGVSSLVVLLWLRKS
jgi:hypothetical protein